MQQSSYKSPQKIEQQNYEVGTVEYIGLRIPASHDHVLERCDRNLRGALERLYIFQHLHARIYFGVYIY